MNQAQILSVVFGILAAGAGILWWISSAPGLNEHARELVITSRELPVTADSPEDSAVEPEAEGWTILKPWPAEEPLTPAAWAHLPPAAVRYFQWSGVEGRTPAASFSLKMEGRIRQGPESPWMDIEMRQYNHMDPPARIVFIRTTGGPMTGVDSYVAGRGRMVIRLFNLVTLTDSAGPEMDVSAQVTFLNDLIFCPTAYFSLTTRWREGPDGRLRLRLDHRGLRVEAELEIGPGGELKNWKSSQRFAEVAGKNMPDQWETPLGAFGETGGLRIPKEGRGVHNYDGKPYDYFEIVKMPVLVPQAEELP